MKNVLSDIGKVALGVFVASAINCSDKKISSQDLEQKALAMSKPLIEKYIAIENVSTDSYIYEVNLHGDTTATISCYKKGADGGKQFYEFGLHVNFKDSTVKYMYH